MSILMDNIQTGQRKVQHKYTSAVAKITFIQKTDVLLSILKKYAQICQVESMDKISKMYALQTEKSIIMTTYEPNI